MSNPAPLPAELAIDDEPFDDDAIDSALDTQRWTDEERAQRDAGLGDQVRAAIGFTIDNDELAEWAMRKVAGYRAEEAEAAERAADWRRRIDAWFDDHATTLARRSGFLVAHLEAYGLARRDADPKAKTTKLPSGTIKTTARAEAVEIIDPEAVLAWADVAAPQIITRTVKVSDLRKVAEPVHDVIGVVVATRLVCGHSFVDRYDDGTAAADEAIAAGPVTEADGEAVTCAECSDGIDEAHRVIAERHVEPWVAPVAAVPLEEGRHDPVPGAVVRPAGVTASVVTS